MRFLYLLVTVFSILALAGCGEGNRDNAEQEATAQTGAAATETETAPEAEDQTEIFYAFLEEMFEERLSQRPEYLTQLGRSERYDEWNDYSDAQVARDLELNTRYSERLHNEFALEFLSPAAQVSYRILDETLAQDIARADFYQNHYPVTHRSSPASNVNVFLINRHHVNDLAEAEAYVARLVGIEQVLDDTADTIRARTDYGLIPPAFMYPDIIEETTEFAALATAETVDLHPLMVDFVAKVGALDIDQGDKDRLIAEARAALLGPIRRGYQTYLSALTEAQTHATTDHGIWRQPRGEDDYASRIRARLGAAMDADDIHDFGLSEVARIQDAMRVVMAQVSFEGTLQDFFTYMNEDEQFQFPNTDEGRAALLADFDDALNRINAVVPGAFDRLPRAPFEVRRVEPFREANAGRAFYNRPTPDGSTPGIVYVNLSNMDEWRTWQADTLLFHEGVPGHHFQIALAQELENTPSFQRFSFNSAYGEGWALYTEQLAFDLGLYDGRPYANFGRLSAELFRAVRLVVDTGLHHKRWSREEATRYMIDNTPLHPDFVDEEIRRYLVWPTQALGYKMGMTEIQNLRGQAQEALGERFDLAGFHNAVIGNGSVPLPVLRQLVDEYVERASASSAPIGADPMQRTDADTKSDRLNVFFAEAYEAELLREPSTLTRQGRRERLGEWRDLSDDATLENARIAQEQLDRLHEFDFDALDEAAQTSYRIFEYRNESRIATANFFRQFYPIHQMFNFASQSMLTLVQYHPFESVEDAEAYLSRVRGYEVALGQIAAQVRDRTAFGVTPPAFTYPLMRDGVRTAVTGYPFDDGDPSPLWADFTGKLQELDLSEEERTRLMEDAHAAFTGPMAAGFADLVSSIEEAIPYATHNDGVWQVPNGDAFYAQRVAVYTQGSMTPEEIHQWGLRDVESIHNQMRAIMTEVGFEGTLQEFFVWLEENPENYYPNNDEGRTEFLADATRLTEQVMARTPEFFNLLPEAPIVVRRIEEFREAQGTIAHYSRPAPDGSSPGVYYANLMSMDMWPRHTMEAITYHEGVPGHHFQIALAQELDGLPLFRTRGFSNTAYTEGWGLYSELVAFEMGFYEDPYSNFGRLATDLWRAVRLVVDTGLHYKRWTREEAYDYMLENTPLGAPTVEREINRYIVWPGQALAYRAGRRKILELRAEAQEALGDDFDIRTFHDAVLGSGAVPLPVLEEVVHNYIEDELAENEGGDN